MRNGSLFFLRPFPMLNGYAQMQMMQKPQNWYSGNWRALSDWKAVAKFPGKLCCMDLMDNVIDCRACCKTEGEPVLPVRLQQSLYIQDTAFGDSQRFTVGNGLKPIRYYDWQ
jgi:hypothetical protein